MTTKAAVLILIFNTFSTIALGQVKRPEPPPVKVSFADSLQAVLVTTKDWPSVQGNAQLFERSTTKSKWKKVGDGFAVVVGRSGLGWDEDTASPDKADPSKREGDGRSPAGLMPLTASFGRSTKPEAVELPYTKLEDFTECVDDVKSHFYNKIVNRMQVGDFDWKSSEKMLDVGYAYDLGVFVGYNSFPVKRGNGSCIFLHIWKDSNTGTSGCTAMERRNLESLIARLQPKKNPYLVQLPEDIYKKYLKQWNLPKN